MSGFRAIPIEIDEDDDEIEGASSSIKTFVKPVRKPKPAIVAAVAPIRDPWEMEGWKKVDIQSERPAKVSPEVWENVFPADYEVVKKIAGRLYLSGREPDQAIGEASTMVEAKSWKAGKLVELVASLRLAFDRFGEYDNSMPPPESLQKAALGVLSTAQASWRDILSSDNGEATAFKKRKWHARQGCCLVCTQSAGKNDPVFQGDSIHKDCKPLMAKIGPAFGKLVIKESLALKEHWEQNPIPGMEELSDEDWENLMGEPPSASTLNM